MPSFDIVSEVDWQEVKNAVNQAAKEITNRYDFKGSNARIEEADPVLTLHGDDDYKVGQMMDILQLKLAKNRAPKKAIIVDATEFVREHGDIFDAEMGRFMAQPLKCFLTQ